MATDATRPTANLKRDELDHLEELLDERRLLPLLPLIYIAWASGELIDQELETIRVLASRQPWIDDDALAVLQRWLDPDRPPTAQELRHLLAAIEERSERLSEAERLSLAELGAELATHYGRGDEGIGIDLEEIQSALDDLEASLGLVGVEAAAQMRESLSERPMPAPDVEPRTVGFDADAMARLLDGDHQALRDEVRQTLAGDDFLYDYDLPLEDYREQVVQWLQALVDEGYGERSFPDGDDPKENLDRFLAIFETLGIFDLSLLVKFGVQFGLFGGSVRFLGSDYHHQTYLDDIASMELQGCYAMTEMGRGSNVRDLETVARYDGDTEEFVIHTPSATARKEWIGGAGQYATMATVYAQLIVGDQHHGVHAFLVPIRDENGHPLEGVRIEDMGHKMGLNGVDNGRLWFDHVRIPRKNLLDRHGGVDADGHYQSSIPSANRRFFTMLGTLVGGRIGVSAAGISAAKTALTIAIRYGANRRQFGPAGQGEWPILDYRMHQRELLPHLATSYALTFGLREITNRYLDTDRDDRRQTEALAAGLKAYSSWGAIDAVQSARECCGGQGYLTINRLPSIRADVDVFATFEGANIVMMQQVARACLADFRTELSQNTFFSMARLLADQAKRTIAESNPVVTRNTDADHLLSPDFQLSLLQARRQDLLISLARRLKHRIDKGVDSFVAFNQCQDHAIALANADIEAFLLQSFIEAETDCDDPQLKEALAPLRSLFALTRIEEDFGWFLENNYLQQPKVRAIRDMVNELCHTVRQDALTYTDAFAIPDECLSAPIAFAEGKATAESLPDFAKGLKG